MHYLAFLLFTASALAGGATPSTPPAAENVTWVAGAAGSVSWTVPDASYHAFQDPVTRRFRAPTPAERARVPELRRGVGAAVSRPLVEERLPGPTGGVRLDLQGRFRSALVATRGEDGRLHVGCAEAHSPESPNTFTVPRAPSPRRSDP